MKKACFLLLTLCLAAGLLAGCARQDASAPAPADAPASGTAASDAGAEVYRVIVRDEDGGPVEGVKVQFCSDSDCRFANTDASGVAVFDGEPGVYTVHILKAPEGYAGDETEYRTGETWGDLTVTLKKG